MRHCRLAILLCAAPLALSASIKANEPAAEVATDVLYLECKGDWDGRPWSEKFDLDLRDKSYLTHSSGSVRQIQRITDHQIVLSSMYYENGIHEAILSRVSGKYEVTWGDRGAYQNISAMCERRNDLPSKPKF